MVDRSIHIRGVVSARQARGDRQKCRRWRDPILRPNEARRRHLMCRVRAVVVVAVAALGFVPPVSAAECPPAVKAAVEKEHSGAKNITCKEEKENGKLQYEATITGKNGKKLELDVTPEGKILLTEERVALAKVPAAVMKSLKAKYADAKATSAVKQTAADGKVTYEIAFGAGKEKKEATFATDGTFVEEEND